MHSCVRIPYRTVRAPPLFSCRGRARRNTHGNAAFTLALGLLRNAAESCDRIDPPLRVARRGVAGIYVRRIDDDDDDEADRGRDEGKGGGDGSALKRLVTSAVHEHWTRHRLHADSRQLLFSLELFPRQITRGKGFYPRHL